MGVADQEARTTCGLNCVSVWRAGFSPKVHNAQRGTLSEGRRIELNAAPAAGPARFDWSEQFIFDLLLDRLQPTWRAWRGSRGARLRFRVVGRDPRGSGCTESLCAMGHGSLDILLTESGGLLEHGYQSVPHITYCVAFIALRILYRGATSALQMFLAIADPSGDSSEYGESRPLRPGMRLKCQFPF